MDLGFCHNFFFTFPTYGIRDSRVVTVKAEYRVGTVKVQFFTVTTLHSPAPGSEGEYFHLRYPALHFTPTTLRSISLLLPGAHHVFLSRSQVSPFKNPESLHSYYPDVNLTSTTRISNFTSATRRSRKKISGNF